MSFSAELFPIFKLTVLAETLSDQGVSASLLLRGTGLPESSLYQPDARVSYRQLKTGYANAIRHGQPGTAIEAGSRLHLTGTGLYGYALLSSPTGRDVCQFATQYHGIVGPACTMSFSTSDEEVVWCFEPIFSLDPRDEMYRFSMEFQFSVNYTIARDIFGTRARAIGLRAAYPRPAHARLYDDAFDCPASFGQPRNELVQNASWLDQPLTLSHGMTHTLVREICDEQLARITMSHGTAGKVSQLLLMHPGHLVGIEEMAEQLGLGPRTLRRRLDDEGATYNEIVSHIRSRLAVRYLGETAMSSEEIAERLGYSDAANFRRAFKRWTGKSPAEYRSAAGR